MGSVGNFAWKFAGIAGICAVYHVGFVLVHKWLKFRAVSGDPEGTHQVFFINPIKHEAKLRDSNSQPSKWLSPGDIFHEISKRIDSAKFSIDLAIYVITCFEVAEALERAIDRGVRVRVIADNSLAHSTGSQIGGMMKRIPVLLFNCADGLMHHKFCLIDAPPLDPTQMDTVFGGSDKSAMKCDSKWYQCKSARESENKGILITGSLNWTMRGSTSNFENVIITSSSALIREFQSEFNFIWTHLSAGGI